MWLKGALPACLLLALAGCQGSAARDPATPPPSAKRVAGAVAVSGRLECARECRLDLFDGHALQPLPVAADGRVSVPVSPGGGDLLLFATGPAQVPQVRAVGRGHAPGVMRLLPSTDTRMGYVAIAVVRVGEGGGGLRMEPLGNAHVAVEGAGGRRAAVTDRGGALVMPLAPGQYTVRSGGASRAIRVIGGSTVVLPIVISLRRRE